MRKLQARHFYLIMALVLPFLSSVSMSQDEDKTRKTSTSARLATPMSPIQELFSFADERDVVGVVLANPGTFQSYLISHKLVPVDFSQLSTYTIQRGESFYGSTMTVSLRLLNGEVREYHIRQHPRSGWICG